MQNSQCLLGLVDSVSSLFPYAICFRHKTFENWGIVAKQEYLRKTIFDFEKEDDFFKGRNYIYVEADTSSFSGRTCSI